MKKNFLYHCYIRNSLVLDEPTNFNLKCIENYIHVFDGEKIACIALDDPSVASKQALLEKLSILKKFDDIILVKNHATDRESVSLISLLEKIEGHKNSLTFYGHNKGSTWPLDECLKNWIFSMYFFNLEDEYVKEVENCLRDNFTTSGILKKDWKWNSPEILGDWHYSGAFFWINNEKFFKCDWRSFQRGRMSLESYLGQRIPSSQAYSTFICEEFNFDINQKFWENVLRPESIGQDAADKYKTIISKII